MIVLLNYLHGLEKQKLLEKQNQHHLKKASKVGNRLIL